MDLRPVALDTPVTTYDPSRPTPAAIVSGHIAAHDAPHPLLIFDMSRIGIGPSSSHTVGPVCAGLAFMTEPAILPPPCHITIDLFGSLGTTGRDHSTGRAVFLGPTGYDPGTVDISIVESILPTLASIGTSTLPSGAQVTLDIARDIRSVARTVLPYHVSALTITATDADIHIILRRIYHSVRGGFVMIQVNDDTNNPRISSLAPGQTSVGTGVPAPYPFTLGSRLLAQCDTKGKNIVELVRANEEAVCPRETLDAYLDRIADTMFDCVNAGTSVTDILPGRLNIPRRTQTLAGELTRRFLGLSAPMTAETGQGGQDGARVWASTAADPIRTMNWVNLFTLAVNEENTTGHGVMTAPTNGAVDVIPAVLGYLVTHCPETGSALGVTAGPDMRDGPIVPLSHIRLTDSHAGTTHEDCDDDDEETFWERRRTLVHDFLLTAAAISTLIKTNTSITGAGVGCQGEVDSASVVAAAGLAQALGESPQQIENTVEIAMEHSLGLACGLVAGFVQVPYIGYNAITVIKMISAARTALRGDGRHTVDLDVATETIRQTGNDMLSKYEETSGGGLVANVVECRDATKPGRTTSRHGPR